MHLITKAKKPRSVASTQRSRPLSAQGAWSCFPGGEPEVGAFGSPANLLLSPPRHRLGCFCREQKGSKTKTWKDFPLGKKRMMGDWGGGSVFLEFCKCRLLGFWGDAAGKGSSPGLTLLSAQPARELRATKYVQLLVVKPDVCVCASMIFFF